MSVVSIYLFDDESNPIEARDRLVTNSEKAAGTRALQIVACVCNSAKVWQSTRLKVFSSRRLKVTFSFQRPLTYGTSQDPG